MSELAENATVILVSVDDQVHLSNTTDAGVGCLDLLEKNRSQIAELLQWLRLARHLCSMIECDGERYHLDAYRLTPSNTGHIEGYALLTNASTWCVVDEHRCHLRSAGLLVAG